MEGVRKGKAASVVECSGGQGRKRWRGREGTKRILDILKSGDN
jgi:hypothetical protein